MSTTQKAIDKAYLLTQLKNFDSSILQKEFTQKYTTMPTLGAELPTGILVDNIVQYTGATNANYTKGYFYIVKWDTTNSVYKWEQINIQPSTNIEGKVDKVTSATEGNFAGLDANGNITDSGKSASDFATPASVTAVDTKIGTLTDLDTEDKTDVVTAINELNTLISGLDDKVDVEQGSENLGKILKVDASGNLALANEQDIPEYTIEEFSTPTSGSVKTYQIKKDNVALSPNIEIPLDKYVSGASIADNTLTLTVTNGTDVTVDLSDYENAEYSIIKQATADSGFFATYQLAKDGTVFGEKINIPKDFLVKSASINTVSAADKATDGKFVDDNDFALGDKYIDFVINVKSGTAEDEHLYLNVNVLVDAYTAEQSATEVQLSISDSNEISATIVNGSIAKTKLATALSTEITNATSAITTLNGDVSTSGSVLKSIKDNAKDATYSVSSTIKCYSITKSSLTGVITRYIPVSSMIEYNYNNRVDSYATVECNDASDVEKVKKEIWGELTPIYETTTIAQAIAAASESGLIVSVDDTSTVDLSVDDDGKLTANIVEASVGTTQLTSAVNASLGLADSAVQEIIEGTTNGTISVDGTDVAVHGLGGAAYKADDYYATASDLSDLETDVTDNTSAITTLNGDNTTTGSVAKSIKDNAKDAIYSGTTTIAQAIAAASADGYITSIEDTTDINLDVTDKKLTATLVYESTNIDFSTEWDS